MLRSRLWDSRYPAVKPMLKFQPSRLRRATSVPTWTPAKLSRSRLEQVTVPAELTAGRTPLAEAGEVKVTTDPDVLLMVASPPTPRAHTPPPCSFGPAPPGLATNALVWFDRKTVCMFAIDAEREDAAEVAKPTKPDVLPMAVPAGVTGTKSLQVCAQAPEEANSATAKALPPSSAFFLILIVSMLPPLAQLSPA